MANQPKKVSSDSSRTQIVVAVIGVVGVVIAAGLTNLDKIVGKNTPIPPITVTPAPVTDKSQGNEIVVDFAAVDTATAPGHLVAAYPYLHQMGISIEKLVPEGSQVALINNLAMYQGAAARPTTSQNFLTQIGTGNALASFTLKFSESLVSVSFIRPVLYAATESGITHPAWSAHALDVNGREISSHREELTKCLPKKKCTEVPARFYILRAPGFDDIYAIRFDSDPRSDGKPFAAFSAVLIERLTMTHREK